MKLSTVCVALALVAGAVSARRVPPRPEGAQDWHLIELSPTAPLVWLSPEVVDSLPIQLWTGDGAVRYLDVTETAPAEDAEFTGAVIAWTPPLFSYPTAVAQRELVESLIAKIDPENSRALLQTLTDFHTRYYTTTTGVEAAKWIGATCAEIAAAAGRADVSVEYMEHSWAQPSVIVKMEPQGASDEVVIVGAHLDSINIRDRTGRSPGADDDGTGTITVMEVFRVLAQNGFVPKKKIHFQFYAAEEVGLRGSDAMAKAYKSNQVSVYSMLQFDMNGYDTGNAIFRVITDFVNPSLTAFLRLVIKEYAGLNQIDGRYGYAASDHASWHRAGYPACHTKESTNYPPIHTDRDLPSNIDHKYLSEFVKAGLGYAVELALA